ncbi:MAG: 2'-deoxycytidine 5'-triphosphate deaminase [Patescibacteria group bacterium]
MTATKRNGALPIQTLREMIDDKLVINADESCLQPSSMDLPITDEIYRMPGSILPRKDECISDFVAESGIAVPPGTILRRDDVYLCKLKPSLRLPSGICGKVSSKSSTGRIDVRCRLLADCVRQYDFIPDGYAGDLWVEIVPKSFDIILSEGMRLNQLRFFYGDERLNQLEHQMTFDKFGLLRARDGSNLPSRAHVSSAGVLMTVDLSINEIVAYRSKRPHQALDLRSPSKVDAKDYFEAIERPPHGELVLKPGEFYLLGTRERIVIPPEYAAEMVQYDPTIGNLFTHFAGFFDPGFGWRDEGDANIVGNVAVMEVEVHSSATVLRDGQPICIMAYERMMRRPDQIYGTGIKSNYGLQDTIKLAKWFT